MSTTNDGGPAFPSAPHNVAHGLSMRDYFAAKAMHQFLHGAVLPPEFDASEQLLMLAARAYEMADAMIKARDA